MGIPSEQRPEFAPYQPGRIAQRSPARAELTRLGESNIESVGVLVASRRRISAADGIAAARRDWARMEADPERFVVFVAKCAGELAGYGRAHWYEPPVNASGRAAPAGWHLGGVVVRPEHRRRGVGDALVRERLAWIAERGTEAWYCSNERNRATIDLHARFGFVEHSRDFWLPGVTFSRGSSGILFRARLEQGER